MNFDQLKAKWATLSTAQKWLTGIGAFILVSVVSALTESPSGQAPSGQAPYMGPQQAVGPGYNPSYNNGGQPSGQNSGQNGGQYAGAAYGNPNYNGGGSEGMSEWEANQRRQSQSAAAFDQNIRDEDTIRDNETGQTYSGVDSGTAAMATESGAYTSVPTSELSVAGDGGGGE